MRERSESGPSVYLFETARNESESEAAKRDTAQIELQFKITNKQIIHKTN